ncbi:hypothetical protein [Vibrio phage YC]|uniref:Uncharacterized protein n=1 Tax=Vibrio phage YC TaxID=2267403 RepID=A0A384ZSB6_9CAUD|nr:hypothetical protein HWB64_gp183 [Vibrio phage YC]AXC34552.1 hypothetical protein [Vibrio phage YC]
MNWTKKDTQTTKMAVALVALVLALVFWVFTSALPYVFTHSTYTATVVTGQEVGTKEGTTAEFVTVKPENPDVVWGVNKNGALKLQVTDIRKPFLVWETDQDRVSTINTQIGKTVCIEDYWLRSNLFSTHPIIISYKEGACQ